MSMVLVPDEDVIDLADGVYEGELPSVAMVAWDGGLVAAAIPVKPPREWFDDPKLDQVTPLVVQADGRVYGHIAGWKQDHIGMNGRIRAPRSRSDYAFFATGCLECADGSMVNVGQISLVGGHAPLEASVAEAVAHYDNTDSGMMDVAIGEDKHGIWVAGALRPDVDELRLRKLRASGVSGDWRPINGALELVAVCSVNVPGFPIPRARVAAGQPVALVAAGITEIAEAALARHGGMVAAGEVSALYESLSERLGFVEDALIGRILNHRDSILAALEEASEDGGEMKNEADLDTLRSRVHGPTAAGNGTPDVTALRSRVHEPEAVDTLWSDHLPVDFTADQVIQAALRTRVHGGALVARATSHWDAKTRKTAAKRGIALPDGSYPIADKEDWDKARRAIGRAGPNRAKVIRHLLKRGEALGIAKADMDAVRALGRTAPKS